MQGKIFTYPILIKECHLDTFGHVNNATYLALFEEARWDLITQNGYGLQQVVQAGIGPTILEIKLQFTREILLREQIIIETQLLSYVKKIGIIGQRMLRNGELCCHAEFTIALMDLKQRKLILPTKEWLHAIGVVDAG